MHGNRTGRVGARTHGGPSGVGGLKTSISSLWPPLIAKPLTLVRQGFVVLSLASHVHRKVGPWVSDASPMSQRGKRDEQGRGK
eukprot:5872464-Pyramimonas_sp.AAC.1